MQIPIESSNRRLGVAVPMNDTTASICHRHILSTHFTNGVTYLVLSSTDAPCIIIHNNCSLPLAYGQTLTSSAEDVLEAMSLLAQPPVVKAHHSASYTFPTVNRTFPAYKNLREYPRLKIAGRRTA